MKEMIEEYGMVVVTVISLGILLLMLPRLKYDCYWVEQLFLLGIGG